MAMLADMPWYDYEDTGDSKGRIEIPLDNIESPEDLKLFIEKMNE
jgi:hypothetical protein